MLSAPPDVPGITGCSNGSTVSAHVGTAITLVCRADHGDPPYRLTWTNGMHDIHDGTRSDKYVKNQMGNIEGIPSVYTLLFYTPLHIQYSKICYNELTCLRCCRVI